MFQRLCLTLCLHLVASWVAEAQSVAPYKQANQPIEQRVQDLLARMTPEEKFRQLFAVVHDEGSFDKTDYAQGVYGLQLGGSVSNDAAMQQLTSTDQVADAQQMLLKINALQRFFVEETRLGIPAIFFGEALHGVVAKGATSFPQAIALAASFDTALMHRVSTAIALETQQRGVRHVLSPVVNIASDVRWGRVEETYGEDQHLTSEMGVAFVQEFEQRGIVTTPKHFVANVGAGGRDSYPIHLDAGTLDRYYYPPFKACIERGGSRAVMSSYNAVNGAACSMNRAVLHEKLRVDWRFGGVVISDAAAVGGANVLHNTSPDYPTSGAQAIENGLDIIFQTSIEHDKLFNPYFLDGRVSAAAIDTAVARVLRLKFGLGLFEQPYALASTVDIAHHADLARKAAEQSMVLLKNQGNVLPLSASVQKIAVFGPDAIECRLGGYSSEGNDKTSLLDALKNRLDNKAQLTYFEGVTRTDEAFSVIEQQYLSAEDGTPGITARYYNLSDTTNAVAYEQTVGQLQFHYTFYGPDARVDRAHFRATFTGQLKAPKSGVSEIGLEGNDGFRLYINDQLLIDQWGKVSFHRITVPFRFVEGRSYKLRIEFYEPQSNAQLKLIWNAMAKPPLSRRAMLKDVKRAKKHDVIVFAAGIEEGEFRDRARLGLLGNQVEWIRLLAATGRPVIVTLTGGSAITMTDWLDDASAVLHTWYGGEQQGAAIANILFGDANPSGRLPITFPMHEGQLPLIYNHEPTGRGDDYTNLTGLPLFPFGYGLSYTEFAYTDLTVSSSDLLSNGKDTVRIRFTITNTGKTDGAEVAQLYTNMPVSTQPQPVIALKQFQKVYLRAGESREVVMHLTPHMLAHYTNTGAIERGMYRLMIGSSSRQIRLHGDVKLKE